jgi:hypothetical protein
MLDKNARLQILVDIGLLPETAQTIVDAASSELPSEAEVQALADMDARDYERVRAFVLYSPIVPDWMRRLWDAASI